jgi:hypothetical protein
MRPAIGGLTPSEFLEQAQPTPKSSDCTRLLVFFPSENVISQHCKVLFCFRSKKVGLPFGITQHLEWLPIMRNPLRYIASETRFVGWRVAI